MRQLPGKVIRRLTAVLKDKSGLLDAQHILRKLSEGDSDTFNFRSIVYYMCAVSYTHLTLPTNSRV